MSASPRSSRSSTTPSPRSANTACAGGRSLWAGPPTRSPSSTLTRASPAPRPPTGKRSSSGSPKCPWDGPGSCSAWNARAWPNSADWHQLLELCGMTGTLICDEDGLYDPRNFNDRLLLDLKGQMSEAELHFIRARLRGGIVSKARRGELITPLPVGLVYDAAGHVILDPDTAVRKAVAHPVRHLRRHRVGHRVREGVQYRGPVVPLAAPGRAPQGRDRLEAAGPPRRAADPAQQI